MKRVKRDEKNASIFQLIAAKLTSGDLGGDVEGGDRDLCINTHTHTHIIRHSQNNNTTLQHADVRPLDSFKE